MKSRILLRSLLGLFLTATAPAATFSDANWSALGSGLNYHVYALALSGTNLYAGGGFTTAGGSPASHVAKWNGSAWSALGSGVDGDVYALVVSGTDLYAGGRFTTAGGNAATNIAKWNGSAWSALGAGMNQYGYVFALAVSGTNLYAGGWFTTAGGNAANHIAKWNGSAWSALGAGMNDWVEALALSGTNLYAGGGFTTAGGSPASNVAKWNGSAWSALGSGVDGDLYALVVSGTDLYAGGGFTTAGGNAATNIAKWNGSAWSALGAGMYGDVRTLGMSDTNLYAGGNFTMAGGSAATYIAKWNGSAWSSLGAGMNNTVGALVVSGTKLYAGGYFTTAGGKVSSHVAKAVLGFRNAHIRNGSTPTFCAETDNIAVYFYQDGMEGFSVEALHPSYINQVSNPYGSENWDNCTNMNNDPVFYFTPQSAKLFDNGDWVVNVATMSSNWRTNTFIGKVGTQMRSGLHTMTLSKKIQDANSWPQVIVIYGADGNWRIKPHPPTHLSDVPFGSSFQVGPVIQELRPVVNIRQIEFDPVTANIIIDFVPAGQAVVNIAEVSRTRTRLDVAMNIPLLPNQPWTTFRSMFVSPTNCDTALAEYRLTTDDPLQVVDIMSFSNASVAEVTFARTNHSWKNEAAPDLRFFGFSGTPTTNRSKYLDLSLWDTRSSPTTNNLNSVLFANGMFMAVGDQGTVLTSTNGTDWVLRTSHTTNALLALAFGNNVWVACGGNGTVISSSNGVDWVVQTFPLTYHLSVAYGNGRFLITHLTGGFISYDGYVWEQASMPSMLLHSVTFGNGIFVGATGEWEPSNIWISTNGWDWSIAFADGGLKFNRVTYQNGMFFALAQNGLYAVSEDGGATWSHWAVPGACISSCRHLMDAAYGNGDYVLAEISWPDMGYFITGSVPTWNTRSTNTHSYMGLAFGHGSFVAVGTSGQIAKPRNLMRLAIQPVGNAFSLQWPTNVVGATLESSVSLGQTSSWIMHGGPTIVGTNYRILEPAGDPKRFYRLNNN